MEIEKYDSTADTLKHRLQVQKFFHMLLKEAIDRIEKHDESKLSPEEKDAFDIATPRLKHLKFGSPEYQASLDSIAPALKHHYENNSHHPEHHKDGIQGMNLIDIIEMFCDWKAATLRHETGDIMKSIGINKKKFGFSDDLEKIFINTAKFFDNSNEK